MSHESTVKKILQENDNNFIADDGFVGVGARLTESEYQDLQGLCEESGASMSVVLRGLFRLGLSHFSEQFSKDRAALLDLIRSGRL